MAVLLNTQVFWVVTVCIFGEFLLGLSDPEDEGNTVLRNIENYSPNDRASHPQSLESSCMILSKTASYFCIKYLYKMIRYLRMCNSLPVVDLCWTFWSWYWQTTNFLHIISIYERHKCMEIMWVKSLRGTQLDNKLVFFMRLEACLQCSNRLLLVLLSSGLWSRVDLWKVTDISKESVAFIFKAE